MFLNRVNTSYGLHLELRAKSTTIAFVFCRGTGSEMEGDSNSESEGEGKQKHEAEATHRHVDKAEERKVANTIRLKVSAINKENRDGEETIAAADVNTPISNLATPAVASPWPHGLPLVYATRPHRNTRTRVANPSSVVG